MSHYTKGRRLEYKTMRVLEAAGYYATRSAGSKGLWDVIGISSQETLLVQVKANDWPGSLEMEQMELFQAHPRCRKIIHRWRDRARQPDVLEVKSG